MKRTKILVAGLLLLGTALLFASGTTEQRGRGPQGNGGGTGAGSSAGGNSSESAALLAQEIGKLPKQSLSPEETEGLLYLREEEKLARDVYLYLGEKFNARAFLNIAESEETHMAYVKVLLDKYGIPDPVGSNTRGVFTNPEFTKLYKELTQQGSVSAGEAFKVGMLIEELDLADLDRVLKGTDNADIRVMYQNLAKGSRNHLRAFNRQIERENVIYQPKYISPSLYDRILSTPSEGGGLILDPNFTF
ncbi:MAG: hypothetical protein Kow009_03070 [Spirochaetales bacterium]